MKKKKEHKYIVYEKVASTAAWVTHGDNGITDRIIPYTFPNGATPASGGVLLERRVYNGEHRPHSHPRNKPYKTTIAGKITVPLGSTIAILVRKNKLDPGIEVLRAINAGNVLRVARLEPTGTQAREKRKATRSKLRRFNLPSPYFLWIRDQYRFAIVKG